MKITLEKILVHTILFSLGILMLLPFLWTLMTSLKTYQEVLKGPLLFPLSLYLGNYTEIFKAINLSRYMLNSVIVSSFTVFGSVFTSAMAAYAFSRINFHGRKIIFSIYLAMLMVPLQVRLIPSFILMKNLSLIDTLLALILPNIFSAYGVFMLRQFFKTLPRELEEAALLDGANHFIRFWKINVPLIIPAITSLAILNLVNSWNDYLFPLVFIHSDFKRTLTLGISLLRGDLTTEWNLVMAGTVVSVFPLLLTFLLGQQYFTRGIAISGLKG